MFCKTDLNARSKSCRIDSNTINKAKMPRNIRLKDLNKLSGITGVPVKDLDHLGGLGLINTTALRDLMVISDWKRLKAKQKYRSSQIIDALTKEYDISKSVCYNICYNKKERNHYCDCCGSRILRKVHKRNGGMCDKCISIQIRQSL